MNKANPPHDLPTKLSQPAQRALAGAGIDSLERLSHFSEAEISRLHGIGPNALAKLRTALAEKGLSYKGEKSEQPKEQTL